MAKDQEDVPEVDSLLENEDDNTETFHNFLTYEQLKDNDSQQLIYWYNYRFTNKKTQNRIHQILGFREIYLE